MFRFRKSRPVRVVPRPIMDEVPHEQVDDNGVTVVTYCQVPNSEIARDLPNYSDYQLSKLLAANVPLQPVNAAVLDSVPSDEVIEQTMSALEERDNESNEPSNDE